MKNESKESAKVDRVYIKEDDRKTYSMLKTQGPLKGLSNKELFMLALTLGIKNRHRTPYGSKKPDGFFLLKDLNEKETSLFYAIAISEEKSLDVLTDKNKVFKIAEEYANCGIHLLKNEVFEKDHLGYIDRLETFLRKEFERQNTNRSKDL